MAEKSKKKDKLNKGDVKKTSSPPASKKPSMKTASDVISRLLWDASLPQSKFSVGYLDRFDGIIEKPFTSLDWSDPCTVDNYTLSLPKHRIQYFKYKNRKVWDKRNRKDIVFGSTGYPLSIYDFMSEIDQEELNFCDEDFVQPAREENSATTESTTSSECGDSDEECEVAERPNFFIAARITNKDTIKNLQEVSDYIKSKDEVIGECCSPCEIYHLTFCILKLDSPSEICDVVSAMQSIASQQLPAVTLCLEGLDNFRHRVLYSRVVANSNLLQLRQALLDELVLKKITITDRFSFVPHITVTKLSRPVARLRHTKYIDQYLYLKFEDNEFGTQNIDKLYLCEMIPERRDDGFYRCVCEVPLNTIEHPD